MAVLRELLALFSPALVPPRLFERRGLLALFAAALVSPRPLERRELPWLRLQLVPSVAWLVPPPTPPVSRVLVVLLTVSLLLAPSSAALAFSPLVPAPRPRFFSFPP